jgi:hypothetical protein
VSQSQLAVSNKKPRFGPKVETQAWWIEKIKEDPIYQYTEEWTKHSEYQVARWKILAELDYKALGTRILRGAPGLGQACPPKIEVKPFWFKPLFGVDFKDFKLWSWLEATKSLGLPISEEADKWFKHISTEDLKEGAIKLLGVFKEEFAPELDDYQESEYSLVYPTTPLIESIVLDTPVGPNYKYLNNTIKNSSYFPTTESGQVIKKKYLKVYLEECFRYKLVYLLLLAYILFTLNLQVNKQYATQVRSHNRWHSTNEDSTKISITNTRRRSARSNRDHFPTKTRRG